MQNNNSLVSIERVVAFVLGPAVVAGSGWLSTWLATKLGIKISSEQLVGIFATGGLSAGALAWKWLHGRQQAPVIIRDAFGNATHVFDTVSNTLTELGITKAQQATAEHVGLARVEEIARQIADKVVAALPTPGPVEGGSWEAGRGVGSGTISNSPAVPPVSAPIAPAANDPAPATPVQAEEALPDVAETPPPVPQSAVTPDGGALSPGAENAPDAGQPTQAMSPVAGS